MAVFSFVLAYSPYYTHPDLTEEIAKLWNLKNNDQNFEISHSEIQWMRQGAINEDTPARWINHFYDPVHNKGWSGKHFGYLAPEDGLYEGESMAPKPAIASIEWVVNQEYQSVYGRQYGNQTWQKALKAYIDGDRKTAFTALGHILHLIEDVSVPDHTRDDTHADVYGDPGSPYEKYSKEYTNFNKVAIAENLKSENLLSFLTIQDAFNYLANYSNNNFFSEDTISNDEFGNPNLEKLERRIENIDNEKSLFLYNKQKQIYLAILQDGEKYSTNDKVFILPSYFSNLTQQVVLTGASVLDLFFHEAERYKQNPELLPEIVPDSNEATLSYLRKSPRLLAVNASDVYDRVSTDAQIYYAKAANFLSNVFSAPLSSLPASVGTISSAPQQQQFTPTNQSPTVGNPIPHSETAPQAVPSEATPQPAVASTTEGSPTSLTVVPEIQPSQVLPTPPQDQNIWIPDAHRLEGVTTAEPIAEVAVAITTTTIPALISTTTSSSTIPVYQGGGWVSGVSPDALLAANTNTETDEAANADVALEENTATSTEQAIKDNPSSNNATTTQDAATTTEAVFDNASSTESAAPDVDNFPVVINEVSWMGTKAQANDEWIELYNKTDRDIDLDGWTLESKNQKPNIQLEGTIKAKGYFLLERTASATTNQAEDMIFAGALNNSGPDANLYLKQGTTTIDFIDFGSWPAGENPPASSGQRKTMERVSAYAEGDNQYNWKTYSENYTTLFAKDQKGNDIFGTPGRQNSVSGYYTPAAPYISKNTIWHKIASPYHVPAIVTIQASSTLEIEPGVVVKFAKGAPYGGGINVNGVLKAVGSSENNIIFTSFLDDQADGFDSNRDATSTAPAVADWPNINFLNPDQPSTIKHAQIKYGGQGKNNNPNGWYPAYTGALSIQNSSPEIFDSLIENNQTVSIYIKGDSYPKIHGNTIKNTGVPIHSGAPPGGVGIQLADASSSAEIIGNIMEDNKLAIESQSASSRSLVVKNNIFTNNARNAEFYGSTDWNLDNSGNQNQDKKGGFYIRLTAKSGQAKTLKADIMPYILENGFTVEEGGKLTIESGAVLKAKIAPYSYPMPYAVYGILQAQGTADKPITFTSFYDDSDGYDSDGSAQAPAPGAWNSIHFIGATSSDSVLEYVNIRYGGSGQNVCPYAYFGGPCMKYEGTVFIAASSPAIINSTMDQNLAISVYISGASGPAIKNNSISNTVPGTTGPHDTEVAGYAVSYNSESNPIFENNIFSGNVKDIVMREG